MSSADPSPHPPASLRTRLAVACAAAAVLVALVAGVWLAFAGLRYFRDIARQRQLRMLRELKWEYLAGSEIPGPVPKRDLSPPPPPPPPAPPPPPPRAPGPSRNQPPSKVVTATASFPASRAAASGEAWA